MKHHLFLSFVAVASTLITGCATGRQIQFVDRIQRDTIYFSNLRYDSIYIYQEHTSDYHLNPLNPLKPSETDTVFIKDRTVEYRYRLLRDTVFRTRVDSIPYEVTVVETKAERYVPWWAVTIRTIAYCRVCKKAVPLHPIYKPYISYLK